MEWQTLFNFVVIAGLGVHFMWSRHIGWQLKIQAEQLALLRTYTARVQTTAINQAEQIARLAARIDRKQGDSE